MRRLLVALTPVFLSVFLILLLLSIFAAGTAAARPIDNLETEQPASAAEAPTSPAPRGARPEVPRAPHALPEPADSPDSPAATLDIEVNYGHDYVAGLTDAWATVVVTVTDKFGAIKEEANVEADGATGAFFVGCTDWFAGWCEDIVPGDVVRVWAAGLLNEVNPVGTIGGLLDAANNTVDGWVEVGAPGGKVDVRCEVWEDPGPSPIDRPDLATGGDTFQCDFTGSWDLERGQTVALRYYEPDGDQVINMLEWPWMRVNYAHDWVGGNFPAGQTMSITVTDSLGSVKATARVDSDYGQGWGGGEGFNSDWYHWSPETPDIQAGDPVHFSADNGYTNTLEVGDIGGSVDVANDNVSGPILAPLAATLPVECHPWGAWNAGIGGAPIKDSSAEPDGSLPYTCAWDPATEWDVQPGQDIGVMYIEPDDDRIINVLREPAPYLRLNQWTEGDAAEGGNYVFHYDYWNDGDAAAENVVFTSTLDGMAYLVDASPFTATTYATPDGEIVELDMGTVLPDSSSSFDLFVQVTEPVSNIITSTARIATTTSGDQGEPWEKEATWVGHVEANDTHLNVGKWAWTGDPAPGEDFIFTINVCNNGSTASTAVTVTDNFQASAITLQEWWGQQAGWNPIYIDPGTLQVGYPSIPGYSCREVYAQVYLDAGVFPGDNLENLAAISAANDLETDDNEGHWSGNANEPHFNLWVDKWWNSGILAPGGRLDYGISYGNDGNVPSGPFWITETLPAGTTFVSAWHSDPYGGYPFPPDAETASYVAWLIPEMENGFSEDFSVQLAVDQDAEPGPLTNEVLISSLAGEDRYDDNSANWTEILKPSGPNLRVEKWHWWEHEGRLRYAIRFENIGDQTVSDVSITDVLPEGTQWDEDQSGFDRDRLVSWDIVGARTLIWNYSEMYPGESRWIYIGADLDSPGEPLRWYTNTVDITIPSGDVNTEDNLDEEPAFSGGEVRRVEFWFHNDGSADMWGEAVPGYPVTITVPSGQFYAFADPDHPDCSGCWNLDTRVPLLPGDPVEVMAGPGLQAVSITTPSSIEAAADSATEEVFGQIGGWTERPVEVHGGWFNGYREVPSDGAGNFLAVYPDVPRGGRGYIRFMDEVDYAQVIYHKPFWDPELVLETNYGHDWIQGYYEPGHTIWITVTEPDGSTVKGLAELTSTEEWWGGEPGFSTDWNGWLGDRPDLQADDVVFAKADNGYENAVQLGDLDFNADYGTDIVSGNLFASWVLDPLVHLRCELWGQSPGPGIDDMVDPDGGAIFCDFGGDGYDIAPGNTAAVMYWEGDGDQIINTQDWPSIRAIIGPNSDGDRYLWGHNAESNSIVEITIEDDLGGFVDSTTVTADERGNWNAGDDLPEGVLALWNVVEVDFGNGLTDTLTVYPMGGTADPGTDVVEVTAAGPEWFDVDLQYCSRDGWCNTFDLGQIGSSGYVSANLLTEFGVDVQWGDSFEAVLNVWNGHQLYYAWLLPAPELGVWKWQISGSARPGGVFPYGISYVNNGNGPAEGVVIVDTLPPGTAYVGDTSFFPHTPGPGNTISWNLGTVDPDTNEYFVVTLEVLPDVLPGEAAIDPNCVEIVTTTEGDWDPENNSNCASPVDVWEDEVEIGVQKWSEPGDPHPGQEFDYRIEYCNYRGAAAGPVFLTDTLPAGVTLLDWWVDDWFEPWLLMQQAPDHLALYADSLPGDRCGYLTLRVLLGEGVPISTTLENWIEISVADDVWLDNNWQLQNWTHVSLERYDLWVGKSRNDGVLVPGGYAGFSIDYGNNGNVATSVHITETLPPGFSYVEGWWSGNTPWEGDPIPDPAIIGNQLIWDFGPVPVNRQHGINFILAIDPDVEPGSFENCAIVSAEGPDDYPPDNDSCVTFTVQPPGPNLWVDKWHWWNGDGQLQYQFNFANFGDQMVSDVWITDTLPAGTQWDGWWDMGFDWSRLVDGNVIVDGDQLIWHFSELYPGDSGWIQFNANLDEPGAPLRWYTNIVDITIPAGETAPGDNHDEDEAFSGGEVSWVDLNVYGNSIWGYAPWGPIHIQTPHEEAFMEWDGDFGWDFELPFLPGDVVVITAGPGAAPVTIVVPDPFDVEASSISEQVSGQVDHLDGAWLEVDLYGGPTRRVQTDNDGFFDVIFSDIPRAGDGEVRYGTEIDYAWVTFHRYWKAPDLILQVDYGYDRVEGLYEPGHTVWITVTQSDGLTVKATAELYTGVFPWWSGGTGFSTDWHSWIGAPPDIVPGDWVYGLVDNGYSGEIQVFTIDAFVDVDTDSIIGTLDAPWYVGVVDTLDVDCIPWGAWNQGIGADVKQSAASPNGATPFLCEWDPATEWDVDYYQEIGVQAYEPDGDSVLHSFAGEAVDLGIYTWAMNGYARPGGVAVYGIWYQNYGNIPAENTHIVATLPAHTSYADDTSGLAVTVGPGNTVTWDVGDLKPAEFRVFRLTLAVDPGAPVGAGVIDPNYVLISTTSAPLLNPGDDEAWSEPMDVQTDDVEVEIGVDKWVWPEDPTPGEIFFYTIEWCNNRGTAAGPVVLTDTLPSEATLLEWHEGEWWNNYWREVSFDGTELILYAPGLPGDACWQIELVMELDGETPLGNTLINEVVLSVDEDVFLDNNYALNDAAQASVPRYDLGISKQFHNGQVFPGGWINYFIDYRNNGNITTNVVVTETVPPGLIFEGAWWGGGQEGENELLPEPMVFGNLLTWELGDLPVGGSRWFHAQFSIDPDMPEGTEFGNCVTVAGDGPDDWPDDNEECMSVVANPEGPNLKVAKRHWWPNEGQISYEITFWNTGSESFFDVMITDTLPIGVSAADEPGIDYWSPVHIIDNTAGGQWGFVVEEMDPGDRGTINFTVNLDDPELFPAWYTNTVDITIPSGDVDPEDNHHEDLAGKIPDAILRVTPPLTLLSVGDTFTVEVEIENVTDMGGIALALAFDPAIVEVVDVDPSTPGVVDVMPGECPMPDIVLVNEADNGAGTVNYDVVSLSGACNGSGVVLRIPFHALAGGSSPVQFTAWAPINSDGFDIPVFVKDGLIEVSDLGLLQGQVELQGRRNHSGAEVCVGDDEGSQVCDLTDAGGYFSFWLQTGSYTVTVEMMPYLGGVKHNVPVADGATTRLARIKLLGGDASGDGQVDILDLAFMGGRYLTYCGPEPNPFDERGDVNADCAIDIRDMVIAGSNYLEEAPVAWP